MRRLVSENNLSINDLILPIFVRDGKNKVDKIKTMPGVFRYSVDKLSLIMNKAKKLKIPMVAFFHTHLSVKNKHGSEALNEDNLICQSIKLTKKVLSKHWDYDVALDPYTSHGHDGILIDDNVDNDKTIEILVKQALLQAKNGL